MPTAIQPNDFQLVTFNTLIANATLLRLRENPILSRLLVNPEDQRATFSKGNTLDILLDPVWQVKNAQDGENKQYQKPTQQKTTLVLSEFKEIAAEYFDLDEAIGNPQNSIARWAPTMAESLAEDIETNLYQQILNDDDIGSENEIGSPILPINEDTFGALRTAFVNARVPKSQAKICILSPDHYQQYLKISRATEQQTTGDGSGLRSGVVREFYGMQVEESTYLPFSNDLSSVTSGSQRQQVSLAMTVDSVLLAMRPLSRTSISKIADVINQDGYSIRTKMWEDPNSNGYRMSVDTLYGVKVMKRPTNFVVGTKVTVFPILGGVA